MIMVVEGGGGAGEMADDRFEDRGHAISGREAWYDCAEDALDHRHSCCIIITITSGSCCLCR